MTLTVRPSSMPGSNSSSIVLPWTIPRKILTIDLSSSRFPDGILFAILIDFFQDPVVLLRPLPCESSSTSP